MKKQIATFGGGLLTGLCLVLLLSASMRKDESVPVRHSMSNGAPASTFANNRYVEVPIGEFFKDIARYNWQHAKVIQDRMPTRQGGNKLPSRMFIYSVNTLEAFFKEVKDLARTAEIPADDVAIRFYYGVYPLKTKIAGENYSSLHTLFMVPNYWSEEDARFRDFDIRKLAKFVSLNGYGNKKNEIIRSFHLETLYERDKPNAKAFMLDASALTYSGPSPVKKAGFFPSLTMPPPVINQGQLCPPNCPANTLLDYVDNNREEFPGDWE